jgi:hypothetical protein
MMPESQPALPTDRAFVVQFRARLTDALPCWEGRVEHLVSGQVARFQSMEELQTFMRLVLTEVHKQSRVHRERAHPS